MGQQKLGNKIIGLPQHTCRKLPIKDEIRHDLVAEPGHLSFGIAVGRALRLGDGVLKRYFAAQMPQQLGHSDALHRRQIGAQGEGHQRRRLVKRALRDH